MMAGFHSGEGCSEGPAAMAVYDQFPAGLRVLVVDDDASCLRILEKMLLRLMYRVTICSQANVALTILRERKGCFDLVLSDVHMPGMDGYKLLEHVGLEMDLPVIMMSADRRTSTVMTGINHGACDYLIKPIRLEELKNIWQHVVRKKWIMNKDLQHSGALDDRDQFSRSNESPENAFSVNECSDGSSKHQRKRGPFKGDEEDDFEKEDMDPAASKKPRVVWSVELHQQFVSAVNHLGIDKAVPKRILELMNVPGLTRENVASHLQKFRLYLKRLSGVAPQSSMSNTLCNNTQPNLKLGRSDIQTLAASGQIHPQTLAALFGPPVGNLVCALDQPTLLQPTLPGPKCLPAGQAVTYGHPVVKCLPSDVSKHFQHSVLPAEDLPTGFGVWQNVGTVGGNGSGKLRSQNENFPIDMSQKSNPTVNVQPSCHVVPSPLSNNCLETISRPASVNQSIAGFMNAVMFDHTAEGPLSPCASSACSVNTDNNNSSLGMQTANNHMISTTSRTRTAESNNVMDHMPTKYPGLVHRGNPLPSRFAIDEMESSLNNLDHGRTFDGERIIKQELDVDHMDIVRTGTLILQQFPSNELMSVITE